MKIDENFEPKIIKHISNTKFPNLRSIELESNEIVSIESIGRVEFPCLENMGLSNNNSNPREQFPRLLEAHEKIYLSSLVQFSHRLERVNVDDNQIRDSEEI